MEGLAQARRALEQRRHARDAAEGAVEELCVKALSRRCAQLQEQLRVEHAKIKKDAASAASALSAKAQSKQQQASPNHAKQQKQQQNRISEPLSSVREKLIAFYKQRNAAKVKDVDTVLEHFEGRLEALNEALILQYGEGLHLQADVAPDVAASEEIRNDIASGHDGPRSILEKLVTRSEDLFRAAAEEMYLPRHKFHFRSSSGNSMVGLEDFWIEEIAGSIRADLCLKTRHAHHKPSTPSGSGSGSSAHQKQKQHSTEHDASTTHVVIPELGLRTIKPIIVKCRTDQIKIMDKVVPSNPPESGIGSTYTLDSLDIECEVDFALVFEYRHSASLKRRCWRAAPTYSFEVSKLKTQRPVVDSLLRTVINSALPAAIRRVCEKNLVHEIGTLMLDPRTRSENETNPMGFAILCEILVRGWPPRRAFKVDLCRSLKTNEQKLAAEVLRKLNITADQINSLRLLNDHFLKLEQKQKAAAKDGNGNGSSSSGIMSWVNMPGALGTSSKESKSTPVWAQGLFPLKAITLEELINLRNGLFVADLVATPDEDLESDEEGHGTTDDELFTASEDSDDDEEGTAHEDNGDESHRHANGTDDEDETSVVGEDGEANKDRTNSDAKESQTSGPSSYSRVYLSEFKSREASTEFAQEYNEVVAHAARAQAVAQDILDEICDKHSIARWRLARLIQRLERHVLAKPLSAELHVHAVDCRLDADVTVEILQSLLWKELKLARPMVGEVVYQRRLQALHQISTSLKLAFIAIKSLAGNLRFTFTGAVTGGNLPAFELSMKDLTSEGVVDLQLSNLRLGGNFKEFIVWFLSFVKQMRSRSAMSRDQKKKSTQAIHVLERDVLKHVELLQCFLDLELGMFHHQSDVSLICGVTAQKENPRPALSCHVAGDLWNILPHDTREFPFSYEARKLARKMPNVEKGSVSGAKLAAALSVDLPQEVTELARSMLADDGFRMRDMSAQDAYYVAGFTTLLLASVDGKKFARSLLKKKEAQDDDTHTAPDEEDFGEDDLNTAHAEEADDEFDEEEHHSL